MYRILPAVAVLALACIGCSPSLPSNPSEVSDGTVIRWLEEPSAYTSAHYLGLDGRIVLVVWSDIAGESSSNSTSSGGVVTLHGESTSKDGRKLVWRCDATADGAGTLTLDDREFDLAEGRIFLVSMADDSCKVQQLKRGTIATSTIDRKIREFAQEQEVAAFFSQKSREEDRPDAIPQGAPETEQGAGAQAP